MEYVIHLAALHEVPRSVEQPLETHEINVTGILNLLLSARDAGVKRFVYASSSAVYGDNPILPRSEDMVPVPISSPYAVSKLTGEYYCQLFSNLYDLDTVSLRYFNVYGPRQDSASHYAGVIPKFISALLSDAAPTIYGDGEQTRDFLYVADCVAATLAACHGPAPLRTVLNVGTGQPTTVNQLCTLLQGILHRKIPPRFNSPQPGDIRHDYADIEKAKRLLSYQPTWDIHRGLGETVIFGWDTEKEDVFASTMAFLKQEKVPVAYFNILTPHKGTPLYDRMNAENRIIDTYHMGRWPGIHCYIKPTYCSAEKLEEHVKKIYREFYTYSSIFARLPLPVTQANIAFWVVNLSERKMSRADAAIEDFDAY